jgi:hypothetical protein
MLRNYFCAGTVALLGFLALAPLSAQDLSITPEDIRIEQRIDGGFHLYIRKKPGIESVLLTETTRDPTMGSDNYAYRAPEWNAVNGDELRILNGAWIPPESGIRSLIDSTPETYPALGEAFHVYIPNILNYGYPDTRHGEVYVVDGTYLSIRSFSLPYADYRGSFLDNPFVVQVTQRPQEGPAEDNYMPDTQKAFEEITTSGGGTMVYSTGPQDLVKRMRELMEPEKGRALDMVLCLDTTSSMDDDIEAVRDYLIPMLERLVPEFPDFRIGMVLYKDYNDEYLTRVIPFTRDFAAVTRNLNDIRVGGGRDIPEAVYEALYDAATQFPWEAAGKMVMLIGDAPPHARPRGRITKAMVDQEVAARGVKVNAIILPQ